MATERKRKRNNETGTNGLKRRHVTSDKNKQHISDDVYEVTQIAADIFPPLVGGEDEDEGSDTGSEEEEWTGLKGAADGDVKGSEHTGSKPKKPPTGEELRNIKDATELYRSSSFKLQIDALLPNVHPKYERFAPLDRFLHSLYSFLHSIPSVEPEHPLTASRRLLKKGIAVPYSAPQPTEDTNWKVSFIKPNEVMVVGSWPTKLSVKAKDKKPYRVDVAVEMPVALFQEKDYLNGRFFHKRAYYLAVVASAIARKGGELNVDVLFDSVAGDSRLTTLMLRPKQGPKNDWSKLNVEVRIMPTLPSDCPIPLQRLSPSRSNIRTSTSEEPQEEFSTPLYNTALLLGLTPRAHLLRVYTLKEAVPAFADALTLLRVWANQRGYSEGGKFCVRGFEGKGMWWAAVLDLLIHGEETSGLAKSSPKRKPLGKGLSSYQLFRAALDFFARHDFTQERVYLKSEGGHRFLPQEYNTHEAVFVDSTSSVNLLAGVPMSSLDMLKHDAKLTLETLNDGTSPAGSKDPFREVFLKDFRDLQSRFDVVMRVDLSSAKPSRPSPHVTLDHGSPFNALIADLASKLRSGLSDRIKALAVLLPTSSPRSLSQAHPSNSPIIYIGLVLNTDHAFRLVDHGPPADDPNPANVQQFRDFWGDKAELRRFKDGSIVESVVWDVKNVDERAHIPFNISRYLLSRHSGIPSEDIQGWQASYDSMLRLPESIASFYQAARSATGFKTAMTAFEGLVKSIKALDDELPLAVLNISPSSESLRYTNAFVPVALPPSLSSVLPACARYAPVMDVIIEFEKSGRWPDDLKAIQKIKLAFFETLATALMKSVKGLRATVVVGDGVSTSEMQDVASLEIITSDGWAFSARIWHDREAILLDKIIDDKPHIPKHLKRKLQHTSDSSGAEAKERQEAMETKALYIRRFIHAPRHHRAIAALSHRFSAFAGTVRLVKRWLASHWLLHGYISEEVVELICASIFLGSDASSKDRESVPGTKERGLAVVVEFLKDWEWENGLFVPLLTGGKSGAWAVSTELDPTGHMWTSNGPDAIVARRVRTIAKASWSCLQEVEGGDFDVKTLFVHPTEHYDILMRLDPSALPRYYQNITADPSVWKGKYANAMLNGESKDALKPGFDPAQLLFNDLKRVYKDTLKIFHDPFGGNLFGAVWDPTLKEPRPFRVLGGFSSTSVRKDNEKGKDKSLVVLNTDAVLSEIERLGAGLVTSITVQV
ncbi:hypothetical protein EW026_g3163 [Hermanssonia centrifuga]|uniref:U3 small nucleolar RNA-associated protein 22 n=1 Tax=Hermanssonia centrifuga TaxID=98765 RepID=A0A4S4KL07_9APHY|nr:hypothetical protein EW026_g3163 [Hermanssonia centrifuga]